MKDRHLFLAAVVLAVANVANGQLAGEYVYENLLSGHATLRISIQQTGRDVSVSFEGYHKNPDSVGPRGTGTGRGDNQAAYFEFKDSCGNSGDGLIMRRGGGLFVSMRARQIADFSCLVFYQNDLLLKSVEKK